MVIQYHFSNNDYTSIMLRKIPSLNIKDNIILLQNTPYDVSRLKVKGTLRNMKTNDFFLTN